MSAAIKQAFAITLRRSLIGLPDRHRRVLTAIGLKRMHQTILRTATPAMAGMLYKVKECVEIKVVANTLQDTSALESSVPPPQSPSGGVASSSQPPSPQ